MDNQEDYVPTPRAILLAKLIKAKIERDKVIKAGASKSHSSNNQE